MTSVSTHPYWHRFDKGGCLTCGYNCIDCPNDVASCKCTPKTAHVFDDLKCSNRHCRIHWHPSFKYGHERYPFTLNMLTSEQGWVQSSVFCGPGAFYPSKKKM